MGIGYTSRIGLSASDGVERVIEFVDRLLAEGRVIPGQRLIESEIANDLGIGRAQVREGLRILAGDGVVDLARNQGARIRKLTKPQIIGMLKVMESLLSGGFADYVRQKRMPGNIKRLKSMVAKANNGIDSKGGLELLSYIEECNAEIVRSSGNEYLVEVMKRTHFSHYNRYLALAMSHKMLEDIVISYGNIADLLEQGDVEAACRMLHVCFEQGVEAVRSATV